MFYLQPDLPSFAMYYNQNHQLWSYTLVYLYIYSLVCWYVSGCVYTSTHTFVFHLLFIINNVMNTQMKAFMWTYIFVSLGEPRNDISGSYDSLVYTLEIASLLSQAAVHFPFPVQRTQGFSVSLTVCPALCLMIAILRGEGRCLMVVLVTFMFLICHIFSFWLYVIVPSITH